MFDGVTVVCLESALCVCCFNITGIDFDIDTL